MNVLKQYLAVGSAGFVGAVVRFALTGLCGLLFGTAFPVGTMVINISGSLLLGWFVAFAGQRVDISYATRLAVTVGFLGAYTTFSTLMYESSVQLREAAYYKATFNLAGSVVLGMIAIRAGMWLAGE